MSKISKKSINKVIELYRENNNSNVICNFTDENGEIIIESQIRNYLTIPEKGMFVDRVVFPCFDEEGDFMPQYIDPLFMITLLQMTTNIPPIEDTTSVFDADGFETGEKTSIINIEKTYELCKAIDLAGNVKDKKYQKLVQELKELVKQKLDFMKEINIRKATNPFNVLKPIMENLQNYIISENIDKILENVVSTKELEPVTG